MAVPLGNAGATWKAHARAEAQRIDSSGLFADMESAVRKATVDWVRPDPAFRRHLIVLTDGKVDISANQAISF